MIRKRGDDGLTVSVKHFDVLTMGAATRQVLMVCGTTAEHHLRENELQQEVHKQNKHFLIRPVQECVLSLPLIFLLFLQSCPAGLLRNTQICDHPHAYLHRFISTAY